MKQMSIPVKCYPGEKVLVFNHVTGKLEKVEINRIEVVADNNRFNSYSVKYFSKVNNSIERQYGDKDLFLSAKEFCDRATEGLDDDC